MKKLHHQVIAGLATIVLAAPLYAHHSRAHLDFGSEVDITGRVSDFDWANPHVYITVDVTGADGALEHWLLETNHTLAMSELGWTSTSLQIGDLVSARGAPNRDRTKTHMFPAVVVKQDGSELWASTTRNPSAVPPPPIEVAKRGATAFGGAWSSRVVDPIKDYLRLHEGVEFVNPPRQRPAPPPLNEAGREALASMNPGDDPFLQCVSGVPLAGGMFPSHLEFMGDQLFITGEFNGTQRVIHMGDAVDPATIELSRLGYSVGRIEGSELVIETSRFEPTTWGLMEGLDSSDQKRVVERYWLEHEGRLMQAEVKTWDPVYLESPLIGRYEFGYMPNHEFELYECDIEAANRHLEMIDQHAP